MAAGAGVAQATAALAQAELNLKYATIVSPIDGIVISRNVDVGQTVAAALQAPTLFTIAQDLTRMQVDTNVAEADVGKIRPGMDVTVGGAIGVGIGVVVARALATRMGWPHSSRTDMLLVAFSFSASSAWRSGSIPRGVLPASTRSTRCALND